MKTNILSQNYSDTYRKMIEAVQDAKLKPACASWPMVGCKFSHEKGLFVVGRSLNGWDTEAVFNVDEIRTGFETFQDPDGKEYCCPMAWDPNGEGKNYNTRKSSFWRLAKSTAKSLFDDKELSNEWACHIAWSNLFKLSPKDGNPGRLLRSAQLPYCRELLKLELEELRPSTVLFIVGRDWYKDFRDNMSIALVHSESGFKYIEGIGCRGAETWVLTSRPEYKSQGPFVEEVISAFTNSVSTRNIYPCE
ncbi:MAG: hypothetical protein ABIU05_04365 [Nitrospirales bacterium]